MPRNIELKVACSADQVSTIRDRLTERVSPPFQQQSHIDTYFKVTHGRLKLRQISAADALTAELIQYERPDLSGARTSSYQRIPIDANDAEVLLSALSCALGELVVVRKHRSIAVWGSTRIHLDAVEHLGHFVELETVLDDLPEGVAAGRDEFEAVVGWLGLARMQATAGSYSDLMIEKGLFV